MRAHVMRERLLGLPMPERSQRPDLHIHSDWELSEEEVWEVGSLHGTAPEQIITHAGAAAAKTQRAAMQEASRKYNLLPRSGSSLSLIAAQIKYAAISPAMEVPAAEITASTMGAAGAGAKGSCRAAARSLNIVVRKKVADGAGYSGDSDDEDDDDDRKPGILTPPHLITSRQRTVMASSVMEGAGRTLKGRDLRNVRNAVWKHTGFCG